MEIKKEDLREIRGDLDILYHKIEKMFPDPPLLISSIKRDIRFIIEHLQKYI